MAGLISRREINALRKEFTKLIDSETTPTVEVKWKVSTTKDWEDFYHQEVPDSGEDQWDSRTTKALVNVDLPKYSHERGGKVLREESVFYFKHDEDLSGQDLRIVYAGKTYLPITDPNAGSMVGDTLIFRKVIARRID